MQNTREQEKILPHNGRVIIFDTTLRDGDQASKRIMIPQEKYSIALELDSMGVDVIEAGFAASSEVEFETIKSISAICSNATIASLCRAVKSDIERSAEALEDAHSPRIHTFIATSDIHARKKLKMSQQQIIEKVGESVSHAYKYVDNVEWSAEDAGRTELGFLTKCVKTAIESGATTINLPDTVGYMSPEEIYAMFSHVRTHSGADDHIIFSAHCHDDLGLATANSLAALHGGARQVECTVNGIGERAGNASLEQIVMNLKVREDLHHFYTAVHTPSFRKISNLVATATSMVVAPNTPIVGAHALRHASGIHQDGVGKDAETYEIMSAEDIGGKSVIALTKHSGFAALEQRLEKVGIPVQKNRKLEAMNVFKHFAESQTDEITDDNLRMIFKGWHTKSEPQAKVG